MTIAKTLAAATLLTALGTMAPAAAAKDVTLNEYGERTVAIDISDLNLDHAAGQKALEGRIRVATRKVCGRAIGPMPLSEANSIRDCTRKAGATAIVLANRGEKVHLAVRAVPSRR